MCEYSLYEYDSRLAEVGETLVAYRFASGTIGFVSLENYKELTTPQPVMSWWKKVLNMFWWSSPAITPCAICLPPGARLRMENWSQAREVGFTQISGEANVHRDALVLENGATYLLTYLIVGQKATVLSLGGEDEAEESKFNVFSTTSSRSS